MSRRPSSPSIFARLVHYRPLAVHGQEENQRTEALAAALDSDRIFAEEFLQVCAPGMVIGSSVEIAVETQALAGERNQIDLQVRVGEAGAPEALVWVEVKVKSGLSGDDQLEKYNHVLQRRTSRGVLVHLRPSWANRVNPTLAPSTAGRADMAGSRRSRPLRTRAPGSTALSDRSVPSISDRGEPRHDRPDHDR